MPTRTRALAPADTRRRRAIQLLAGSGLLLGGSLLWQESSRASSEPVVIPPPARDVPPAAAGVQKAIFAGGCFWGVQGVFQHVKGVQNAMSGYSGGTAATAKYDTVSSGRTGHAESVEVTFDPRVVSYGTLLQVFFSVAHDPTQLNRQGPDTGTQYRSALFATGPDQLAVARAYVAQLDAARVFPRPIVTQIDATPSFYAAEADHQDFMVEHPRHLYIVINDQPKVEALQRVFPALYMPQPVRVKKKA
jgi:peptide-methionine (S)-S-oxide reductase